MEILKTNKETADLFQEYLDELAFGVNLYDEETENDEWQDYEDNRERIEYVRSDIAPDIVIFLTKGSYYVLKDFRKKSDKPQFKGAFINSEIYIGDNLLDSLVAIKSKEEVIGEIIGLLQSPARRIISALLNNAEKNGGEAAE